MENLKNLKVEKAKLINFTINPEQSNKLISKKSKTIRYLIDDLYNNIDHNKKNINKYVEQIKRKDLEFWRKQRKEPGKHKKIKLNISLYKIQRDRVELLVEEFNLLSRSQLIRVLIDSQFKLEEV